MKYARLFFAAVALLLSCAAHSNLQPLGEGHLDMNAAFGGPVVEAFDTQVPLPISTIGANYGISSKVNATGQVHLTALAYQLLGVEAGAAWFPIYKEQGATVTILPRFLFLASFKSGVQERVRLYPSITASGAWPLGKGKIYGGADLTIPISQADYDPEAVKAIVSPFIGYRWALSANLRLFTELKWTGANVETYQLAVNYLSIGRHGAFTTLFSLERSF